ncbi:MAG: RluA family pseudouridine synthase [Bacteroidota bacterium]
MKDQEITILFENEDYAAAAKPEGMATIPERSRTGEDLCTLLGTRLGQRLFTVHRLDKEVSGVVIFARNPAAHKHLNLQFDRREVKKQYVGLLAGAVEKESGVIDIPLRVFGSGRTGADKRKGKPSKTYFDVLARSPDCTLVRLRPVTGRRHQIRAHCYLIGHPVAGDARYGEPGGGAGFPRLMLHALEIRFLLCSGEQAAVRCPPGESFRRIIREKVGEAADEACVRGDRTPHNPAPSPPAPHP